VLTLLLLLLLLVLMSWSEQRTAPVRKAPRGRHKMSQLQLQR
jgi:hypothetical protein